MHYLDSLTPCDVSRRFQQFSVELFEKLSHRQKLLITIFAQLDKNTLGEGCIEAKQIMIYPIVISRQELCHSGLMPSQ